MTSPVEITPENIARLPLIATYGNRGEEMFFRVNFRDTGILGGTKSATLEIVDQGDGKEKLLFSGKLEMHDEETEGDMLTVLFRLQEGRVKSSRLRLFAYPTDEKAPGRACHVEYVIPVELLVRQFPRSTESVYIHPKDVEGYEQFRNKEFKANYIGMNGF